MSLHENRKDEYFAKPKPLPDKEQKMLRGRYIALIKQLRKKLKEKSKK